MDECLHRFFIWNKEIRSSCDFNPFAFASEGFVYEVIRVIDGVPLFLDEHLQRLTKSAELAHFGQLPDQTFVAKSLVKLIEVNAVDSGNIKLVFRPTTPDQQLHYAAWFQPHSYPAQWQYDTGISVALFEQERQEPNAKIIRQEYRQAVAKAIAENKVDDVLLVHQGKVTEGSKSNVFFIQDKQLITAPESQVLPGITRQKVIEIARRNKLDFLEKEISVEQVKLMDAACVTGTSPKIMPIKEIVGIKKYVVEHEMLQNLMALYDAVIRQNIHDFKSKQTIF